jgi:Nuclease-related domain
MRMIPATPYNTHSPAERMVFDRLRTMLHEKDASSLTAFHSLNLTQHAWKRFGEIDFLLCGQQGIFVLEVKGGRVACSNGRWLLTDRNGREQQGKESPFRQAELALHGVISKLQKAFSKDVIDQFVIGYGVIFPDCDWPIPGAEWDDALLSDARAFRGFDAWLNRLFTYWRLKSSGLAKNTIVSASVIESIQSFLRPDFETVVPLSTQTDYLAENTVRLTEDQLIWLDVVEANPRTLCTGGAGTGKTLLALELARRWTADGAVVLLACASPWLKAWLEARMNIRSLVVSTVEGIEVAANRLGISHFDALIADEAQDLMQVTVLDKLNVYLKNGLPRGQWCLFGDFQNQNGLVNDPEQSAMQRIENYQPVRVPLRTNCRNTSEILENIKIRLGADMGIRGSGYGPAVREFNAATKEEAVSTLGRELDYFVQGGISYSQITILSPFTYKESLAAALPEKWKRVIFPLDLYGIRNFPPDAVSFSRITDFKGLENEAVIVVDLSSPLVSANLKLHYVAMSRARSILSVITTEN